MQGEYWNSIDEMPLYNWIKCNKGNIEFTRKSKRGTKIQDYINWKLIYNEYLKDFGFDVRYKKYLEAKNKRFISIFWRGSRD